MKRSVTIAGHRTSIALEPEFWEALREIAQKQGLAINELVRTIDAQRTAEGPTRNLSSAIRVFVLNHYKDQTGIGRTE